jgi:hypothetical protein
MSTKEAGPALAPAVLVSPRRLDIFCTHDVASVVGLPAPNSHIPSSNPKKNKSIEASVWKRVLLAGILALGATAASAEEYAVWLCNGSQEPLGACRMPDPYQRFATLEACKVERDNLTRQILREREQDCREVGYKQCNSVVLASAICARHIPRVEWQVEK